MAAIETVEGREWEAIRANIDECTAEAEKSGESFSRRGDDVIIERTALRGRGRLRYLGSEE